MKTTFLMRTKTSPTVVGASLSTVIPAGKTNHSLQVVDGDTLRVDWDHEPTAQEQSDLQAELDAADYAAWFAENGGDPVLTARRLADGVLDRANDHGNMVDKAIVLELVAALNILANRHGDLLQWLGTQATLTNRGQLPGFAFPAPTPAQARQSLRNRITSGEADG